MLSPPVLISLMSSKATQLSWLETTWSPRDKGENTFIAQGFLHMRASLLSPIRNHTLISFFEENFASVCTNFLALVKIP